MLHAERLRFVHPLSEAFVVLSAPPPPDLRTAIELARGSSGDQRSSCP